MGARIARRGARGFAGVGGAGVRFASAVKRSPAQFSRSKKDGRGNPAIKLSTTRSIRHHSASDFACRFVGALSSSIALANIIGSQNSIGMSLLLANVRARIAPKHRSLRR
jgi:hypothetical protein